MADRFEDLRTFVSVVSCGGINAAAAELGIAKSAVSRRISDLESRIGAVLLERSKHHFRVTETGRSYFERAKSLLADLEALDADPSTARMVGAVSIAAPSIVARHLLAPAIAVFLSDRPGVQVTVLPEDEPADVQVASDVRGGTVLFDTGMTFCAARSYLEVAGTPRSPSDLERHDGVLLDRQIRGWSFAAGGTRKPRAAVVVHDEDVALAMAIAGCGIALLPDFAVRHAVETGEIATLLDDVEPASSRVTITVNTSNPLAAALADELARSRPGLVRAST